MRLKNTSAVALTTLMASMLLAQNANASDQSQWLPYNPRLQVSGTLSQEGIFNANGLVPLYGNWDGFVYGAVNARYSTDDTGLLAPGLGLRYVAHNNMYGAYVFADAARTNPKANFWVINPGVEWASPRWDAHVNGYIPTKRSKALGKADFYSNYGDYSHTSFTGHSQYDALGALSVAVGQGADAEVGYSIPMRQYRSRVFLGGYYFTMPQDLKAVQGVAGGIQLPLNAYADLILSDSYDKLRRHEVALSVRLTLGSKNTYSNDVHTRLLDSVERHVGMWGTGNGTISQQSLQATGQRAMYRDNIWFFKPNSGTAAEPVSLQTCTFEHPCSQFDQQTIDSINQVSANANFYLTPGTYNIAPVANQEASDIFHLNQGQSVYGRNSSYQAPARGDNRALLAGPVTALGNNVLDSVRIVNNDVATKVNMQGEEEPVILGLYLPTYTMGTVTLRNADVQAISKVEESAVGMLAQGGHLIMQGGSIHADSSSKESNGLVSTDSSQITLNGGSILAESDNGAVVGIVSVGNSHITANDVAIIAKSSNDSAIGILDIANNSKIILNGGSILAEGVNDVFGISSVVNSYITANDVAIIAKNSNDSATGIASANNSKIILNGGSILAEGVNVFGITSVGNSHITANDVAIIAKDSNDSAVGILANNSKIILNGGSILAESVNGKVIGIASVDNSKITARNVVIKANGGSEALGLYSGDGGTINLENIQLSVSGPSDETKLADGQTENIHFSGNNICKVNGQIVTCS